MGKTHLAISLAVAAGRRVYYGTLAGLIDSLTEAKAAGNLSRRLRVLTHPALLVVDEIGYLPVSQEGAVLFFQLINARHERASTVLTSNKGFEEWGHVLGDEVMANRSPGRPPVAKDIRELIVRMAQENPTWGYTRLRGALKNLGHELGRNTIKRLLAEHGIAPARSGARACRGAPSSRLIGALSLRQTCSPSRW